VVVSADPPTNSNLAGNFKFSTAPVIPTEA